MATTSPPCANYYVHMMSKRSTMARKKAMTRAEMISTLKSRGQKGALSKMTKPQLKALLEKTAPPGTHSHEDKGRTGSAAAFGQRPEMSPLPL